MDEIEVEEVEKVECCSCATSLNVDDSVVVDGDNFCPTCTFTCEDCREVCAETFTVLDRGYNSIEVCESCRDNCLICHDCHIEFSSNARYGTNSSGETVCESCSMEYFSCDQCGETCHNDDYGGDGYCYRCRDNEDEDYSDDCDLIKGCNYKPTPEFHGTGPYYMGMELETESKKDTLDTLDTNARFVLDKLGSFVYLKEDGSLNNGFEIVTHPATLDEHRKKWSALLDKLPEGLSSFERDNCGLHIHASRKHLSQLTIGKILAFVNARTNKKFVTELAQRNASSYAELKTYKQIKHVKYPEGRYEALNLTNKATIEFRIFKGNLSKDKVFRALEFVDAIIKFCERSQNSIQDCVLHSKFIDHVARHKKEYPELHKFCTNFAQA